MGLCEGRMAVNALGRLDIPLNNAGIDRDTWMSP